jgi:hypothetical protein
MDKKREEKLGNILEDIYDKLKFLKEEVDNLREHIIKLTLQGNDIMKTLRESDDIEVLKIDKIKEFDKDIYIESLISLLETDKDFKDLQDLLDEYEDELSLDQYGES